MEPLRDGEWIIVAAVLRLLLFITESEIHIGKSDGHPSGPQRMVIY